MLLLDDAGEIREALHDSADTPRLVETIPRKGYRFLVDVAWLDYDREADVSPSPSLVMASMEAITVAAPRTEDARTYSRALPDGAAALDSPCCID